MKHPANLILFFMAFCVIDSCLYGQADDHTQRTKEFVVMGYQGIQIDLTSGKGPYLRTLLDLLHSSVGSEDKTTDQVKFLFKTYPNIMDFADQVVVLAASSIENKKIITDIPVPSGPGIYSGDKLGNALEHLTRGMTLTVTLKTGEQLMGKFSEYALRRLWIIGAARRSVLFDDILALEAHQL